MNNTDSTTKPAPRLVTFNLDREDDETLRALAAIYGVKGCECLKLTGAVPEENVQALVDEAEANFARMRRVRLIITERQIAHADRVARMRQRFALARTIPNNSTLNT